MVTNSSVQSEIVDDDGFRLGGYGGSEDDLLARFDRWDKSLTAHWEQWRIEAKEDYDFVAGHQWSQEEISEMAEVNKIAIVFNRIAPTVDAVCGAEIAGRQQVQYFPREAGDTAVNDILTQGAEFVMQECDGEEEDSDASRDCLICGVGVTETRPDDDYESGIVKERIDPLELWVDPGSKKACFADARYLKRDKSMSRDEAIEYCEQMGWPEYAFDGDNSLNPRKPVIVDPRVRYKGENETYDADRVSICEWQWFDRETVYQVATPDGVIDLTRAELEEVLAENPGLKSETKSQKRFWRAFVGGGMILEVSEIEVQDFTYKFMTGKRDRNKGTWYGLVRAMIDPQKWANKLYSQIMHILRTNASGGLMMEEGAVEDIREFETTWADPAANTFLANGALSNANGARIQEKRAPAYPQGLDRLMEVASAAIRDTTGINQELLGLADRQQPGVLEAQRKQAAYGILACFFDSFRRYRKMQGRLLLRMIQLYMPADKLVRIVGPEGSPQYVPMALAKTTAEYDVVVDEAPSSPNQKIQTFQVLQGMMPLFTQADLPASFWAEVIKYSPLPASLSEKISKILTQTEQQAAEAEQQQAQQQQPIMQAAAEADIEVKRSTAAKNYAQADQAARPEVQQPEAEEPDDTVEKLVMAQDSDAKADVSDAKATLDRARAAQIWEQIVNPPEKTSGGD